MWIAAETLSVALRYENSPPLVPICISIGVDVVFSSYFVFGPVKIILVLTVKMVPRALVRVCSFVCGRSDCRVYEIADIV